MHEIVTLQFGQKANYLATHFWNAQESYFTYTPNTSPSIVDHDVLFRPGIGTDGSETYTPRTVIYDLKGGFGSLKKLNALYEDLPLSENDSSSEQIVRGLWQGQTVAQKQQRIPQTRYQEHLELGLPTSQLNDNDVRYWSDFNRVFFHPRSIVQLNEYSLHSQLTPFENWSAGEELWTEVDKENDLLDRDLRPFVEEADQLQGFQIFAGVDDAWGGWTSKYVDALQDEFPKKAVWVWGLEDGTSTERTKILARATNAAKSLQWISNRVSAYVRTTTLPHELPRYVNLDENSDWKSTALIEPAIESITLPCRIRPENVRPGSLNMFDDTLNTNGRQNLFEMGVSFRKGERQNMYGNQEQNQRLDTAETADMEASNFDINFTPLYPEISSVTPHHRGDDNPNHVFAQVECYRGPGEVLRNVQRGIVDREELLRRRFNDETIVEQFNVPLAFPKLDTFPDRFIQISSTENRVVALDQLQVHSGMTCTSSMKRTVFELRDLSTRSSRTVQIEDREEMYHNLTEIGEQYAFGWENDDSNEDDD